MRLVLRRLTPCFVLGACLCAGWLGPAVAGAFAQEEETEAEGELAEVGAEQDADDVSDMQEAAADDASAELELGASDAAVEAAQGPRTWWFGGYLQGAFVPSFMLTLFLDDAPTVSNLGFGLTATHRNADGMSLVLGLGYASYAFQGPFRISGDPEQDTEFLDSTLAFLHLRGQMLWSTEIVQDKLSFEYGVGLDIGLVLGEMKRTEAYRDPQGNWQPCSGPLAPNALYCEAPVNLGAGTDAYDAEGAHYGVVEKRVPPVMLIPMLPALALRYTPIPELAVKLDAAFGLMQFAVGLSAAYGTNL